LSESMTGDGFWRLVRGKCIRDGESGATANPGSEAFYDALLVNCPRPKPTAPPPEFDRVTPETGAELRTTLLRRCRKRRTEARFTSCAEDSLASFSSLYPSVSTLTAPRVNWFREGKFTFGALVLVRSRNPVTSP
jgi:hypothetical protein